MNHYLSNGCAFCHIQIAVQCVYQEELIIFLHPARVFFFKKVLMGWWPDDLAISNFSNLRIFCGLNPPKVNGRISKYPPSDFLILFRYNRHFDFGNRALRRVSPASPHNDADIKRFSEIFDLNPRTPPESHESFVRKKKTPNTSVRCDSRPRHCGGVRGIPYVMRDFQNENTDFLW